MMAINALSVNGLGILIMNEYKDKLKELKAQATKLYPSIAKCHQLKSAKVQMSKHLGNNAGEAHIAGNMIYLNPKYCKSHPEEMRDQILGHEFCHIIAPLLHSTKGEAHKPKWKQVMREMNLRPETYHTMEV